MSLPSTPSALATTVPPLATPAPPLATPAPPLATPGGALATPAVATPSPLPGAINLTTITTLTDSSSTVDSGVLLALTGGVVGVLLLLLLCVMAVLLWCLSRHKGSYVTNETDEDDVDEESLGSDAALQSIRLKTDEDA